MTKSKLSEVTGCGHFASIYRDYIFFASPVAAKSAIVSSLPPPSAAVPAKTSLMSLLSTSSTSSSNGSKNGSITPQNINQLLSSRPQSSYIIRIEWSMYDYDSWNADRRAARRPQANDFHAYLLAIDALPAGAPPSARRTGWLIQSLWYNTTRLCDRFNDQTVCQNLNRYHYDSSITALTADQLSAHLIFCGRMDGRTAIPVNHHYHFTSTFHYGI
jgi:hypothetical protein